MMNQRKKKLLFITPWPPTGTGSGGQVVSGALLRLYRKRFDVDVIAGFGLGYERSDNPALSVIAWVPLRLQHRRHPLYGPAMAAWSWLRGRSLRAEKMLTRGMRQAVSQALRDTDYDLVHVDMALMRDVVPPTPIPVIVSAQNVEPEIFKRMFRAKKGITSFAARLESRAILRAERQALRKSQAVISMSERDAVVIRRLHKLGSISVTAVYPPVTDHGQPVEAATNGVLLLGSLAAPGRLDGTIWFLESVWPLVRNKQPTATLDIVGSGPPESITRRSGSEGITVWGFVEDLSPIFSKARVLAVPLRVGGGIRIKILEMLERGFGVVATAVAATGLKPETEQVIDVVDDPVAFADRIIRFLSDEPWSRQRAAAGRAHVLHCYGWASASAALDRAIDGALGNSQSDPGLSATAS